LPTTLEYIGDGAFTFVNIASIYIPKNVSYIGEGIFSYSNITEIKVDSNNQFYYSEFDCIIEKSTKTLIMGCKNSTIPTDGSVTIIGKEAFYGQGLVNITIPNTIKQIGDFAFSGNTSLKSIVIPTSVEIIGRCAFQECWAITIYCEVTNKPIGWNSEWNYDNYPVIWGETE